MASHKGRPKPLGSGRKKGTRNVTTLLEEELLNGLALPERMTIIQDKLFKLAYREDINAIRIWFDHIDRNYIPEKDGLKMDSFATIKESAQRVMDKVYSGSLSLIKGKELMGMLHEGATFRKMAAEYAGDQMVVNHAEKNGHVI